MSLMICVSRRLFSEYPKNTPRVSSLASWRVSLSLPPGLLSIASSSAKGHSSQKFFFLFSNLTVEEVSNQYPSSWKTQERRDSRQRSIAIKILTTIMSSRGIFSKTADVLQRGAVLGLLSAFGFQFYQIMSKTLEGKIDSPHMHSTYLEGTL